MAAVGELDPLSLIVGPAQRLREDGSDGEVGAGLSEVAISILVRLFRVNARRGWAATIRAGR